MNAPQHIALIGCGFTGTSTFFQLIDAYPVTRITIFEASGEFGPGYPYREDECEDYLINNTTDTMCLVPSNRRAFVDWLKQHPEFVSDLDEKGHLPRRLYGTFLSDFFAATLTAAEIKGVKVDLVPHEATTMHEDDHGKVHIGWSQGKIIADMAILTTGRCPDVQSYAQPGLKASVLYINNHIRNDDLDAVALDATVHILGASLSAYDVVNRLFSPDSGCQFVRNARGLLDYVPNQNQRKLILCSRSGRLKGVASQTPATITRRHFTLETLRKAACDAPLNLEAIADLIKREAAEYGVEFDQQSLIEPYAGCGSIAENTARAGILLEASIKAAKLPATEVSNNQKFLVDFFTAQQVAVWDAFAESLLSADAEHYYREKIETAVLCYAAPCPVPTAEKLLALIHADRLSVIHGVSEVRLDDSEAHYTIEHAFGTEKARILVNTTGNVDRCITSKNQPALISDLVSNRLLSPYQRDDLVMKGAAVDMASFRAHGARHIYIANMMLWGPGFFTSSAFMMATIVERLLKAAFAPTQKRSA